MDHPEILPISKAPVRKGKADLRPALWRRPRGVDGRSPAGMARPGFDLWSGRVLDPQIYVALATTARGKL